MPKFKEGFEKFDLLWGVAGSPGETGDVASTVEEVRRKLAGDPLAGVRLGVGTREFGEKVLGELREDELSRVTIVLRGVHDRPLAVEGLVSYRYRGPWGFIMIGAFSDDDALLQAGRSLALALSGCPAREQLEVWSAARDCYVPVEVPRG